MHETETLRTYEIVHPGAWDTMAQQSHGETVVNVVRCRSEARADQIALRHSPIAYARLAETE